MARGVATGSTAGRRVLDMGRGCHGVGAGAAEREALMSFAAKYAGSCASDECRYGATLIDIGDEVDYHDDELMHVACAAAARRGDPPLCKACFTYHRGECA